MSPRPILLLGKRGRSVRVVVRVARGVKRYVVVWRTAPGAKPQTQWFPFTKPGRIEAEQFAEGVHDELRRAEAPKEAPRFTTEALFALFRASRFEHLRPRSRTLYEKHWEAWQNIVGPQTVAEDLSIESCEKVRDALRGRFGVNTLEKLFQTVRTVYRWALTREHIRVNKVGLYVFEVGRDNRPPPPPEYSQAEFLAILEALPVDSPQHWRAHTALALCGWQGVRQRQALHLDWSDVDWTGGRLRWRPEWDKMGKDRWQPMRAPVRALLTYLWERDGRPASGWVLPAGSKFSKQPAYTIQSLWYVLKAAERRAGVERAAKRGGHGLRRLLAGNVAELTGDPKLAMDSIGDTDMRQLARYVQLRGDRLRKVFAQMDTPPESANESATVAGSAPAPDGEGK